MVAGGVENTGLLWADGGSLIVEGAVTGSGAALIGGNGTLEFGAASSANTTFAAAASGTLKLDDVLNFSGTISGFDSNDRLDLAGGIQFNGDVSIVYTANAAGNGGTLNVSDGNHTARIGLSGQYDAAGFHVADDGAAGVLVTYVPPSAMNPTMDPLEINNPGVWV